MARDVATIWSYQQQLRAVPRAAAASLVPMPRLNFSMAGFQAQPGLLDRLQSVDRTESVQALAKELRDSGELLRLAGVLSGGSLAGGDKGAAGSTPAAPPSPGYDSGTASPRVDAPASPGGEPLAPPTALPAAGGAPGSVGPARTGLAVAAMAASPMGPAPGCSLQAALEAAAGPASAAAGH